MPIDIPISFLMKIPKEQQVYFSLFSTSSLVNFPLGYISLVARTASTMETTLNTTKLGG